MRKKKYIITAKDIMRITNMSERYAQNLLCKIRKFFGKERHQFVTVREFSIWSGMTEDEIDGYL